MKTKIKTFPTKIAISPLTKKGTFCCRKTKVVLTYQS